MKGKLLSVALAACLFIGTAIPVLATGDDSTTATPTTVDELRTALKTATYTTIDLSGNTFELTGDVAGFHFIPDRAVTIKNGTITDNRTKGTDIDKKNGFIVGTGVDATMNSNKVTLQDMTFETGSKAGSALQLYLCTTELKNVTIKQEGEGAALIHNATATTVTGNLTITCGEKAWSGINMDNGGGVEEKNNTLTFAADSNFVYSNDSATKIAPILFDTTNGVLSNVDNRDKLKITNSSTKFNLAGLDSNGNIAVDSSSSNKPIYGGACFPVTYAISDGDAPAIVKLAATPLLTDADHRIPVSDAASFEGLTPYTLAITPDVSDFKTPNIKTSITATKTGGTVSSDLQLWTLFGSGETDPKYYDLVQLPNVFSGNAYPLSDKATGTVYIIGKAGTYTVTITVSDATSDKPVCKMEKTIVIANKNSITKDSTCTNFVTVAESALTDDTVNVIVDSAKIPDGKSLNVLKANNTKIRETETAGTYSFTMPDKAVTISADLADNAAVKKVTITAPKSEEKVTKGGIYECKADVTVIGDTAKTVKWTVSGNHSDATAFTESTLSVGKDETATSIKITATSTEDATQTDTVRLEVIGGTEPPKPKQAFPLTISFLPEGVGQVKVSAGGNTYSVSKDTKPVSIVEGDSVVLTAGTATGYKFSKWTSGSNVTIKDNKFVMPSEKVTVTANYEKVTAPPVNPPVDPDPSTPKIPDNVEIPVSAAPSATEDKIVPMGTTGLVVTLPSGLTAMDGNTPINLATSELVLIGKSSDETALANVGTAVPTADRASARIQDVFELTLRDSNGQTIANPTFGKAITVKTHLSYDTAKQYAIYSSTDGISPFKFQTWASNQGGKITFSTNHFTVFAVVSTPKQGSNSPSASGGSGSGFSSYWITAKAGVNGSITPVGETKVAFGSSMTYKVTPNSGYVVDKVLIDNQKEVTLVNGEYTFKNVNEPYTISATFKKASGSAETDSSNTSAKPVVTAPNPATGDSWFSHLFG